MYKIWRLFLNYKLLIIYFKICESDNESEEKKPLKMEDNQQGRKEAKKWIKSVEIEKKEVRENYNADIHAHQKAEEELVKKRFCVSVER